MSSWDEEFELLCPVFLKELGELRELQVKDSEDNHDWLRKRSYLDALYDQIRVVYEQGLSDLEQKLMRAGLQRMHVVINTTGNQEVIKIRVEESEVSISSIFMFVSVTLSSAFDQFVKCVGEVRSLLEEIKNKTTKGG